MEEEIESDPENQIGTLDKDEDFYYAQRLQEREVMGHSRFLYDEERARDLAEKFDGEGEEFEGEEGSSRDQNDGPLHRQFDETTYTLSARMLEKEALEKQIEEVREKGEALKIREMELAKQLEEAHSENESLRLAVKLHKKDLAEGHRSLWRKTQRLHTCSDEGGPQYGEDEPHQSSPPPVSEGSEKIPCQWCNKLIPFEQVMLHQVR